MALGEVRWWFGVCEKVDSVRNVALRSADRCGMGERVRARGVWVVVGAGGSNEYFDEIA